jgi:hypothetical protein
MEKEKASAPKSKMRKINIDGKLSGFWAKRRNPNPLHKNTVKKIIVYRNSGIDQ